MSREECIDFRQAHFHNDPVQQYLDTNSRLLIHDIFGLLKEVLSELMFSLENGWPPSQLHVDNVQHFV
jgi:hypothetical protein